MHGWQRDMWRIFFGVLMLAAFGPGLAAKKTEETRGLQPVVLSVPGEARPIALYGESHALVIGAADYHNGWPRLPGVVGDIEAVAKALEQQGFAVSKVMNPAGDKLDKAIKRFIGQHGQKPDSRLLIYFAGHGYTLKPDAERQLGYLVPVDAPLADRDPGGFIEAALSMESLEGYAKQIRAKHALFVFDSCFSGSFFKMRAAPELIALKTAQPVRQFITSGGADQQVPDVSVFRRQFIAALNGEGDLNNDGYITGSELGSFLEDKVTNYSRQTQTPQYGKIRDPALDKGDFVFVLAKPDARPGAAAEPLAPASAGMNLDDLKKQQAARDSWTAWQTRMRADYGQVEAMDAAPELKAATWARFLAAYPETNPYSDEAETLRQQARQARETARRQTVKLADGGERARPAKKLARPSSPGARESYEPEMVAIPGKDYAMGKYEVTQAQWRAVMGGDPPAGLSFKGCDDCPVERVSWDDVQGYLSKLNQMSGKQYRLPTKDEWEYACDGGGKHEYCGSDNLDAVGWYVGNSGRKTHPVGQKQANGYGLYDMSGNVAEWMQDCLTGRCSERVLRGGSWSEHAREAFGYGGYPPYVGYSDHGFRVVVRSASP